MAQIFPNRVEVLPLPHGKRIAFTSSWDDGHVDDRKLIELLNRYRLPATFNLITGSLGKNDKSGHFVAADEVAALYAGHEVAIHTCTHPNLSTLDASQIACEVLENRKQLEDLVGYPVRGMAYPYGGYSPTTQLVLSALGVTYARTVEQRPQCFPPASATAWAPTCHIYCDRPTLQQRWEMFYGNPACRGVFFTWGHSYEIARRNDWAGFEKVLASIANREDVWYCTNIELFDYESARQRIVVAANKRSAYNPSAVDVALLVDGQCIEIPAGKTVALSAYPCVMAA